MRCLKVLTYSVITRKLKNDLWHGWSPSISITIRFPTLLLLQYHHHHHHCWPWDKEGFVPPAIRAKHLSTVLPPGNIFVLLIVIMIPVIAAFNMTDRECKGNLVTLKKSVSRIVFSIWVSDICWTWVVYVPSKSKNSTPSKLCGKSENCWLGWCNFFLFRPQSLAGAFLASCQISNS